MERPDFSSDYNPFSSPPGSSSYLHIQVYEISIYPTGRWGDRQSVKRTLDPSPTSVQDVGVNHCRAHVIMSEKFLNCSYIMTVFQKGRCKRVAQSMAPRRFEDTCLKPRFYKSFLYNRFVKMMFLLCAGYPINIMASRGKHPLPSPHFTCIGIFAVAGGKAKCAYASKDYVKTAFDVREKSRESCKRQVAIFSGLVGARSTNLERGAAVNKELHAGDEICFVGGKEQHRIGHIPRRAHLMPQRHAGI